MNARRRLNRLNLSLEEQVAGRTAELTLYRNIVQSTRFPICAYDSEQRVTIFNKAHAAEWFRVMGYPARSGELLPEAFPAPQAAAQRAFADRALAGEEFTVEGQFGDPDLEAPHCELDYAPIREEAGRIIGAFHHARDVTIRLKAEADLQQAHEALRQSQKMKAVGQLTGGVAHDFNNLLTVIRSSVDLLKRPGLPEERRDRYIKAISNAVERAARLTNQLLAFARSQALEPEVFAACDSVRMLGDMLGTLTGARIDIVTELPEIRYFVNADPSQFDTALVNIAVSARDAIDGEGRLTVRVEAVAELPAVRLHPAVPGAFVAVSVTDTGSGIPPEQMERIFEPFFTTKEQGKGTGLGLSQVFGFAKQSGGEVTVESRVGKGTTFTLYLPRVAAVATNPAEASEPAQLVDGHGTCVLVVEDNADVGASATQTLTELGYRVILAADANAALAELARDADRFDVVFSDVVMPGMSGIELGQRIREDHHDLLVVLTSGYSHVLAQNGTYGFELLHKPYSIEQLSRVLRKAATWQRRQCVLNG